MKAKALEKIETDLLLEAIFQHYGYDFRRYARSSLNRRVTHRMKEAKCERISELLPKVLHDEDFFNCFLRDMSSVNNDWRHDH